MPSINFTVNLRGQELTGNLRNAQDYAVYFGGAYEPFELDIIEFLTDKTPDSICLDIGCNMGQHTLVMAKRASHVYAFDPLDPVRMIAQRRIAENNLANVSVFGFGLGTEECEHEFYFDAESQNNAMGSFIKDHAESSQPIGILRVRNGDEVVDEITPPHVDLIKIDVEGFEGAVIRGLSSTISKFQPFIMFEVTSTSVPLLEKETVFQSLQNVDYEFFEILRGRPILGIFVDTSISLKNITSIGARSVGYNVLAVPKSRKETIKSLKHSRSVRE